MREEARKLQRLNLFCPFALFVCFVGNPLNHFAISLFVPSGVIRGSIENSLFTREIDELQHRKTADYADNNADSTEHMTNRPDESCLLVRAIRIISGSTLVFLEFMSFVFVRVLDFLSGEIGFGGFLLIALVCIAYARVFDAGFIWDDESHLTQNPCIVGPLGLKEIWTSARAVYYPLVLTTFWALHKFAGFRPGHTIF
jgi:hypothetical protein